MTELIQSTVLYQIMQICQDYNVLELSKQLIYFILQDYNNYIYSITPVYQSARNRRFCVLINVIHYIRSQCLKPTGNKNHFTVYKHQFAISVFQCIYINFIFINLHVWNFVICCLNLSVIDVNIMSYLRFLSMRSCTKVNCLS